MGELTVAISAAEGDDATASATVTERGSRREITGRYLLDASGQATVVVRHLGTRRLLPQRHFQKVAFYGHFEGVLRAEGREGGHPFIAMCDEVWSGLSHRTTTARPA